MWSLAVPTVADPSVDHMISLSLSLSLSLPPEYIALFWLAATRYKTVRQLIYQENLSTPWPSSEFPTFLIDLICGYQ